MAEEFFQCEVLTPDGRVFSGEVRNAVMPAHDGQMGVLVNHAPMVFELGYGLVRLQTEAGYESWYIEGGFAQVTMDHTVILTQAAVRPDQITKEAALQMLDAARQIQITDQVSARRKSELEANARARLRICER
jgi:F-type H+-transporting ATPase subunit epsilon